MRVFILALLAFAFGTSWAAAGDTSPSPPATRPSVSAPIIGFHAPDFALATTEGQTISLRDLRGRVVVINFFASWCGPCQREMPMLAQAAKQPELHAASFVGIDWAEGNAMLYKFKRRYEAIANIDYPLLSDGGGDIGHDYDVSEIPQTFIVDADGLVVYAHVGVLQVDRFLRSLQYAIQGNEAAASADQQAEREVTYGFSERWSDAQGVTHDESGRMVVGVMSVMHEISGVRFAIHGAEPASQISAVGTIAPEGRLDIGSRKPDLAAQLLLPLYARGFLNHLDATAGDTWTMQLTAHGTDMQTRCAVSGVAGSNVTLSLQPAHAAADGVQGSVAYDRGRRVPVSGSLTLRNGRDGAVTVTFVAMPDQQ